jgi:hypothetical protein
MDRRACTTSHTARRSPSQNLPSRHGRHYTPPQESCPARCGAPAATSTTSDEGRPGDLCHVVERLEASAEVHQRACRRLRQHWKRLPHELGLQLRIGHRPGEAAEAVLDALLPENSAAVTNAIATASCLHPPSAQPTQLRKARVPSRRTISDRSARHVRTMKPASSRVVAGVITSAIAPSAWVLRRLTGNSNTEDLVGINLLL